MTEAGDEALPAGKWANDVRPTDRPIRYVTNSHHHRDHVFGNAVFAEQGAEVVSSYFTARMIDASAGAHSFDHTRKM